MCTMAALITALSLLLCTPPVVEPLLRNPDPKAPWLAGLVAALVQASTPGTHGRFGLSQDILASVAVALLCMLATDGAAAHACCCELCTHGRDCAHASHAEGVM
ncbi:hypothetical protein DUNSADRAFT_2558 [Dunaliella salina]|uniref:Uncharacterized protein n=1 Tax=Dunaliella salina TaxID=3046 RepID=A0ABQ7GVE8_DUNSA|nr:hypothetical protein DUNSADRAFT_2558 [Dunaliella salina]|eukprot:KAF5838574.1 hypothetical protein DUNSADRAFT_2558 [Dunaliella salina]